MDDPWYPLASFIRGEREKRGFSTTRLAQLLDVSRTTVHNWESGKPIPIERCALLAEALEVDLQELFRLHPHATPVIEPASVDTGSSRRGWLIGMVAGTTIVLATMAFTWVTARADCFQPGAGGGLLLGSFQTAYRDHGGASRLGCAINEVHKWGPGYVQDFEGGHAERSVLMSLDGESVYFIGADLWEPYVSIADGATPDVAGVAAGKVVECAGTIVLPLEGGHSGSGALVSDASGNGYVWLSGDVWAAYVANGGPQGHLGRPLPDGVTLGSSVVARFENGTISDDFGEGPVVDSDTGGSTVFDPSECESVTVAEAAG